MTQLSNVLITDINQNKLSVMKTSDNCVFSKADLQAIRVSIQGVKSLLRDRIVFPRLGTDFQ